VRKLVGLVAMLAIAALVVTPAVGTVVKTTTSVPTSLTSSTAASNVGFSYGVQGPGALASVNTAVFAVGTGSLTHTRAGSKTISYVETAPSSSLRFRFVTSIVAGFAYTYAGRTSFLGLGGSASVSNFIDYTVEKWVDGDVVVVLGDTEVTSVAVGASPLPSSGTDMSPIFEYYGTLLIFTSDAGISASVSSTNTVAASSISWGLATGSIYAFVFGS